MEAKVEERPAIRVEAPAVPKKKEGDLPVEQHELKMKASGVNLWYGEKQALFDVNLEMFDRSVTALIGPSGCGKSTFLRCLDRMNDVIDGCRVEGDIRLDGEDVYAPRVDPVQLRARVGMVFQKPNPFPKSIFENVAYGPRIHGLCKSKAEYAEIDEGGPLGGGEGPPGRVGYRPVGWPAAAALHRPRHLREPRSPAHGRAVLGARPDRHRQDRDADG